MSIVKARAPRVFFLMSICALSFAYGIAVMAFRLPPYAVLRDATSAWQALQEIEPEAHPHSVAFVPGIPAQRHSVLTDNAGQDLILLTGGFFYRTDICPDFGCIAWIMEREGTVLHAWEVDPATLFTPTDFSEFDGVRKRNNFYVQGVDLDPAGNLVVTFQGHNIFPYQVGIAAFSPSGELLWKRLDKSHHWPTTGPDGRIYVPSARIDPPDRVGGTFQKSKCKGGAVYQEGLRILTPDGEVEREFWLTDLVQSSDLRALAYTVRDDCDPYHINGIDILNDASASKMQAGGVPDAEAGDLIASLRSSSSFLVMDHDTGRIKHVYYGPMVAQHSPVVLPGGDILIFDNLGRADTDGHSRILRLDPASGRYTSVFPKDGSDDGASFSTIAQGAVNASPDGRHMLVAETLAGRLYEVELQSGQITWDYVEYGDLDRFFDYIGAKPGKDGSVSILQTQGASYLSRSDFELHFKD